MVTRFGIINKETEELKNELEKARTETKELKEWMATVINSYSHVLHYDVAQTGITLVRRV